MSHTRLCARDEIRLPGVGQLTSHACRTQWYSLCPGESADLRRPAKQGGKLCRAREAGLLSAVGRGASSGDFPANTEPPLCWRWEKALSRANFPVHRKTRISGKNDPEQREGPFPAGTGEVVKALAQERARAVQKQVHPAHGWWEGQR